MEIVPIVIVWTLKVKVKAVFGIRDADAEEERLIVSFIVPPDQFLDHRMGRNYTIFTHLWPCAVDLRVAEMKDKRSYVCSSSYYYSEYGNLLSIQSVSPQTQRSLPLHTMYCAQKIQVCPGIQKQ